VSSPALPSGPLADRYELLAPLARGGMGQVWRARDMVLNRAVAVKIVRREFTDDPSFRARFRSEAQHAARLLHLNVAQVFDYGEVTGRAAGDSLAYLVMELVDGESLAALLHRERRLDVPRTLDLLRQTSAALAAAHRAGIVHRDVKPGNVLLGRDGAVKITDFGIAWSAASVPLTRTGQVIGTPHYVSPEQAQGGKASPASDVYALGAIAYECLAGRRVFDGGNAVAILASQIRDEPEPLPDDVPADIRELVERTLVKDPAQRVPDGTALHAAVERLSGRARTTTPTGTAVMDLPQRPAAAPAASRNRTQPQQWPLPVPAPAAATATTARGDAFPARRRVLLAALGLVAVLAVAGGVVLSGGSSPVTAAAAVPSAPQTSAPPTAAAPTTPRSVQVLPADYLGRPVADVRAALVALGLQVELHPVPTGEAAADAVTAVDRSGVLELGTLVGVSYAVPPPVVVPVEPPVTEAPAATEPEEEQVFRNDDDRDDERAGDSDRKKRDREDRRDRRGRDRDRDDD
jgi:eukaryotic-like serine/threonine-protein kinase